MPWTVSDGDCRDPSIVAFPCIIYGILFLKISNLKLRRQLLRLHDEVVAKERQAIEVDLMADSSRCSQVTSTSSVRTFQASATAQSVFYKTSRMTM